MTNIKKNYHKYKINIIYVLYFPASNYKKKTTKRIKLKNQKDFLILKNLILSHINALPYFLNNAQIPY